jgi:hypothetical protein
VVDQKAERSGHGKEGWESQQLPCSMEESGRIIFFKNSEKIVRNAQVKGYHCCLSCSEVCVLLFFLLGDLGEGSLPQN